MPGQWTCCVGRRGCITKTNSSEAEYKVELFKILSLIPSLGDDPVCSFSKHLEVIIKPCSDLKTMIDKEQYVGLRNRPYNVIKSSSIGQASLSSGG